MLAPVAYKQAAENDPSNAAPFSNLAAAYFELGLYDAAISACDSAYALLGGRIDYDTTRHRLCLRKAKACLHSNRFDEGIAALNGVPSSDEKSNLGRCL